MRWRFRPAGLALAVVTLVACSAPDNTVGDVASSLGGASFTAADADQATAALLDRFWHQGWNAGHGYLNATSPSNGHKAGYWIFAEAFDATLDAVQRTKGARFEGWVKRFYDAESPDWTGQTHFDDENWMALALIRAYDATGDVGYLHRAEALFEDIHNRGCTADWYCHGIWWDTLHTQKATASNFGPAITAARLFERTGDPAKKTAAERIFDYWYAHMVNYAGDPSPPCPSAGVGHVADHNAGSLARIDCAGGGLTYNEGLGIGAAIELYDITQNRAYLGHARAMASFLIHSEVRPSPDGDGLILHDPVCADTTDCEAFKGIAFRFLTKLYAMDRSQNEYGDVLRASARAIWRHARNPTTNTFAADWAAPSSTSATLAADASAVMALNLAIEFGLAGP